MSDTAKELITQIALAKKEAISKGVIREEKNMPPIENKEIPYSLPNGWQWIRLGDYALKVTDYVASGSFASLKENVLITNEPNYAIMVKTADFSNGFTKNLTYTDEHGYEFLSNSNLFGGELILSNIGSIGKVFIVPYLEKPMTLASNTVMVKVTDDSLIKYLYYYFLSPLGQRTLFSISSGTSMMKFNKTQLKNTLVPVAPLEIQQEIVKQIESVSKIIDLRKEELKNLDDLIKARFVELFGEPYSNDNNWPMKTFGDICTVRQGLQIPIAKRMTQYEDDCYEYITVAYLHGVKQREYIKSPKSTVVCTKDDVLMTRTGNTGMVVTDVEGVFHNNFFLIDFDRTKYNKRFLVEYLKLDLIQAEIIKRAGTSTIPDLNHGQFYAISIYEPPIELQNQFEDFVSQVNKSKLAVQKALDKTQVLFDSLMQKYFG